VSGNPAAKWTSASGTSCTTSIGSSNSMELVERCVFLLDPRN
jgi:hypothetical protein